MDNNNSDYTPRPVEQVNPVQTVSSLGDDKERILERVASNISSAYKEMKRVWSEGDKNRDQYLGKLIPDSDYLATDEKANINHTFLAIETIIPIVTARTPEANVFVFPRRPTNLDKKQKLENYLRDLWEIEIQMQREIEKLIRQALMYKFGVIKVFYDKELQRVDARVIPSKRIIIPKVADFDDVTYVAEYVDVTYGEVVEQYNVDEETQEKLKKQLKEDGIERVVDATQFTMVEYWEDDKVVWKYKDVLIGYEDNPYYDFDNERSNHFRSPRKPYVFFSFLTTGDSAIDETSFIEQTRDAQRILSLRETQVNRTLEENDQIIEAYGISGEQGVDLTRKGTKVVIYDDANGFIRRVPTNAIIGNFQSDQQYITNYMDQLFGTLPTIRGQQDTAETATGRQILRNQALTRQEIIHRNIEFMAQDWYNFAVQIIKLFYKEPTEIYSLPQDFNEWEEDYSLSKADLDRTIVKVLVKSGSTIPVDRITKRAELTDLYMNGAITSKDLLEELGYSNASRLARNVYLQEVDPEAFFEGTGGYDPEAILHIEQIIAGDRVDDTRDIENMTLEELVEHTDTQSKYLQGIQISDDLPELDSLTQDVRNMLYSHQKSETNRLRALQELEAMDAQQPPQVADTAMQSLPLI